MLNYIVVYITYYIGFIPDALKCVGCSFLAAMIVLNRIFIYS